MDRVELVPSSGQGGAAGVSANPGGGNTGEAGAVLPGGTGGSGGSTESIAGTNSGVAGSSGSGTGGGSGGGGAATTGGAFELGGSPDAAGGAGGMPGGGLLLFDDFEDGNDTGWFPTSGDWQVLANDRSQVYQVKNLVDASLFSVIGDLGWTDVAVEATVRVIDFGGTSSSNLVGVYARFESSASHYYVALRADGKLALRKKVTNNLTIGSPVNAGIVPGKDYKVRLEVQGTELRAFLDQQLVLTVQDSDLTAGRIALGTDNARAQFDNVTVTAL